MKKKQILAVLLATSCLASLSVPTFAADDDEITLATVANVTDETDVNALGNWTMDVETEVQPAQLKVTLPTSATVLVNPYRMEVKPDGSTPSYDTVLSPEMEIVNSSKCAIKVGVKGKIQTYKKFDVSDPTVWKGLDAVDSACTDPKSVTLADPDGDDDVTIAHTSDILTDGKNFATSTGYALTVKYTKTTKNTDGSVKTAGKVSVEGYTASTDIKLATSAMKDPDAEKGNSLYMYVEGTLTQGTYAAFTKAANAGVKDTKTGAISTVGQLVLSGKEATATVLYLKGGETGYTRVSGQASTAPTKPWSSLTDKFDTVLTYVIDAVANPAPTAPLATSIKVGGIDIAGFAKDKLTYDITANSSAGILVVNATAESGVTTDIAVSGVLSMAGTSIAINRAGTGTVTIKLSQYGLETTYTLNVTVS